MLYEEDKLFSKRQSRGNNHMNAIKDFLKVVFNISESSEHILFAPQQRFNDYIERFSRTVAFAPAILLIYFVILLPLSYANNYHKQILSSTIWLITFLATMSVFLLSCIIISYYRRYNSTKKPFRLKKRQALLEIKLVSILGNVNNFCLIIFVGLYIALIYIMRLVSVEDFIMPSSIFVVLFGAYFLIY